MVRVDRVSPPYTFSPHSLQNFVVAPRSASHFLHLRVPMGQPQTLQNFAVGTFSALQLGHNSRSAPSFSPHSLQNFEPGLYAVVHFRH